MLCLKVMGELIMIFFNVSQAVEIEVECFQADPGFFFFFFLGAGRVMFSIFRI